VTGPVVLVSSSGGVLLDVLALEPWWGRYDTRWVAVRAADTVGLLASARVTWAPELAPTRPDRVAAATAAALRQLRHWRPRAVLSAGSGVAVPYFLAARTLGVPALWVETYNVVGRPGVASRVAASLATAVVVQHPELVARHRRCVYVGELL
jgi:UDP-N-acetylglucosamine:LPS N-acetylglucosamine transferase